MTTAQKILTEIGRFSENEIAIFEKVIKPAFFCKDDILLNKGKICSSVFYIIKGAAYQFTEEDIDENIIGLHIEADWCLNHSSFINQKPSTATIKCYSDLEVVELSTTTIHDLIARSPAFFQLAKVMEDSRTRYFDKSGTALQKYNQLLLERSALFQRFPLKMIASYLGIAPETMSRIRSIK